MRNVAKDHWWQIGPPSKPVSKSPEHRCRPLDVGRLPSQSRSRKKKKTWEITGFTPWKIFTAVQHHFLQVFFFRFFFRRSFYSLFFFMGDLLVPAVNLPGCMKLCMHSTKPQSQSWKWVVCWFCLFVGVRNTTRLHRVFNSKYIICLDDQKKVYLVYFLKKPISEILPLNSCNAL